MVDGSRRLAVGGGSCPFAKKLPVHPVLADCYRTSGGCGIVYSRWDRLGLRCTSGGHGVLTPIEAQAVRSFLLGDWQKKELVREVRAAPDRVAGKGGAVKLRTRGGTELALISFYAPPTHVDWTKRR